MEKNDYEEVMLHIDEFEAIRLKDFLGLNQSECADEMGISQPTFHRLIISARKKFQKLLLKAKRLK